DGQTDLVPPAGEIGTEEVRRGAGEGGGQPAEEQRPPRGPVDDGAGGRVTPGGGTRCRRSGRRGVPTPRGPPGPCESDDTDERDQQTDAPGHDEGAAPAQQRRHG